MVDATLTLAGVWIVGYKGGKVVGKYRKVRILKNIKFDDRQLQKKFMKHASDFGIYDNYNREVVDKFKDAIINHIKNSDKFIVGNYRTIGKVVYCYNSKTKTVVIIKKDTKEFISGWKLYPSQEKTLLEKGYIR